MNLMKSRPGLAIFWVQKILEPDRSSSELLALLLASAFSGARPSVTAFASA